MLLSLCYHYYYSHRFSSLLGFASENQASHLLREALDPDLQEVLVRSDLLSHLPVLQLVHVPVGQYETAV
jgi:hypothetical protein